MSKDFHHFTHTHTSGFKLSFSMQDFARWLPEILDEVPFIMGHFNGLVGTFLLTTTHRSLHNMLLEIFCVCHRVLFNVLETLLLRLQLDAVWNCACGFVAEAAALSFFTLNEWDFSIEN
jgi:hypothetical protein